MELSSAKASMAYEDNDNAKAVTILDNDYQND